MSKKPTQVKGKSSSDISIGGFNINRYLFIGIVIGAVGVSILGIYLGVTFSQEIFGDGIGGGIPPLENQIGYSEITLLNAYNDSEILNGTIDIQLFEFYNQTNSSTVKNGEVFFVSNLTIAFVQIDGFNNETFWVFTNPNINDPHVNTINMLYLPNFSEVQFNLVSMNGTYGSFDSSDLTIGYWTLGFDVNFNGSSLGNSSLGSSTGAYYIPEPERGLTTQSYNVTTASVWLGFDGAISNVSLFQFDQEVYDNNSIGYNFTQINARITGDISFPIITLNINITSPISSLIVFFGQLDDYTNTITTL